MDILAQDKSNANKSMVWNQYMRGGYSTWPVGQDCEVHRHHDAADVFVFLAGQCEMTVGEEVRVVGAGQTVYVGPDSWHKLKAIGDRPLEMFWAVLPNHSPNHTWLNPDGSTWDEDRPGPPIEDPRIIR